MKSNPQTIILGVLTIILMQTAVVATTFKGAGATFPKIIYERMFSEYNQEHNVEISYEAIGSGKGMDKFKASRVDFAATDIPPLRKDDKRTSPYVYIPAALSAVTMAYNVPGVSLIKLTPQIISKIYLGKITNWNDEAIQSINPTQTLPDLAIKVFHRKDASGTTYVFASYLQSASTIWKRKIKPSPKVDWPIGKGVKGTSGIAEAVSKTEGAIGYIEWKQGHQKGLTIAAIQNSHDYFVLPTKDSISSALEGNPTTLQELVITNTQAKFGYPISAFSWIVVNREQQPYHRLEDAKALVSLLWWMTHQGQIIAEDSSYPALPASVTALINHQIKSITYSDIILL